MKKAALVVVLLLLLAAISGAAIAKDNKAFTAGLKAYNSKNYKAAINYFKEYLNEKPDPVAYYLIGYSLYKLGKFSEADEYFKDAYLIDPEFSLEKVGLVKKVTGEVAAKEPALTEKPEPAIEKKEARSEPAATAKATQPAKQPVTAPKPTKTETPATKAVKPGITAPTDQKGKAPAPAAQKPAAPSQSAPLPAVPAAPAPKAPAVPVTPALPKQMPNAAAPAALVAIIAGFGMILVIIVLAVYLYYCLCLFLIAKKMGVPAPWTAWIPLVQIWTFVASAGKPGWWVLLFLVPLVNLFIGIYLWICITENLGKNKWLGLLILVPLVGLFYPAWLAFSKSDHSGGYTPPPSEDTLAE